MSRAEREEIAPGDIGKRPRPHRNGLWREADAHRPSERPGRSVLFAGRGRSGPRPDPVPAPYVPSPSGRTRVPAARQWNGDRGPRPFGKASAVARGYACPACETTASGPEGSDRRHPGRWGALAWRGRSRRRSARCSWPVRSDGRAHPARCRPPGGGRSNRSDQRCASVSVSINSTLIRVTLPASWTLPSSTYRTPSASPISRGLVDFPL